MAAEPSTQPAHWRTIVKFHEGDTANLIDYDRARAEFSWERARAELSGLPGGGLNIAHEAIDRHAAGARAARIALRCISKGGTRRDLTYADLRIETNRFANVLTRLGVGKGDPVAVLAGRIPELLYRRSGCVEERQCVHAALFCVRTGAD